MKKSLLILLFLLPLITFSQVTTSPAIPTASGEITIIFNAVGTGLEDYTGDIYAHTGVTIDGADWQNVIAGWTENIAKAKLTRDTSNTNLYTLVLSPDIHTFYGVDTSKTISELNFVFRASDGSKQTSPDIYITIYEAGLNITFTNPSNNSIYNLNESVTITAEASLSADLELFIDGSSQQTALNSTTISTTYSFSSSGNHILKAVATSGTETKEIEMSVYIKTATVLEAIPTGAKKGVTINTDNSVTFVLEAPNKTDVFLIGDFNNWLLNSEYQLKQDTTNSDLFWITLTGLDVDTEFAYQYYVDYTIKIADPYSEKILDPWTDQYIKTGNYPNLKAYPTNLTTGYVSTFLINDTEYSWNVTNFTKPAQDNLIIYEMHLRDFTESDSYTEALTKLDYLQNLGINAIELMPINEFEGADSWGYNPALYMALDKAYGTKNDFKKFVDACHERGIAVLADVVFNHSYGQSPLVQLYWDSVNSAPAADNPWYNQSSNLVDNTSAHWGYDFNHESAYTKAFFKDVLSYWMNEYKVDGFRFDFTKGFSNTLYYGTDNWASAYDASRIAILKEYADHVWDNNPTNKPYVIFEHLSENTEEKELANYGIMLWGNLNNNYNQNTMGYSSDTDISWISYKQRGWNSPNVVGYMESHDEERLMYKNLTYGNSNTTYNVKDLTTALSRQELAGMFFFTIPGPKMVWQFGELGYDVSIDDPGRVDRKPIYWNYFDDANRKQIYNTWATLSEFKQNQPVFNTTDFTLNVSGLGKSILLKHTSMDVVIVGNFDITEKSITTQFSKTGTWYEYFTGEEKTISSTSTSITLNPGEYKLYSTVKLLDPRGGTASDDSDNDGVVDTEDLCPNTMEGVQVSATGCPIFSLESSNFEVTATSETCPDKNNGKISITAQETYTYVATINGTTYNFTNNALTVSNLEPGNYNVCISVTGETYEQCYVVTIAEGTTVSGKASVSSSKVEITIEEGTAPFNVFVNNEEVLETSAPTFSVNVKQGDQIQVKTAVSCEGIFSKTIDVLESFTAYPNPTNGLFEISVTTTEKNAVVEMYSVQGQLISKYSYPISNNKIQMSLEDKPTGLYFVKVYLQDTILLKVVKQ
ncbi:alpha-amylase family glycosyl hydrolase [Lutibacter sp.]|uniref:alpha-amylase family glycosyl hydrolase n=1 Tax=Lutibacter sp. TaxID=1925666 RepID=UPI0035634002